MDRLRQLQSRKQSIRGGGARPKCSLDSKISAGENWRASEVGAAITKLEMALNDLAIQTGGLL